MEPKYRHSYPPCPSYDVACVEAWLEHMAQTGLHLDGASGFFAGFATFTEGEPTRAAYRLEAVTKTSTLFEDNEAPADEALDLAEELGWEYVCRWQNFDIYRSSDPSSPELNTDPLLQAQSLKAVEKRMRGTVTTALFWWILYPLLRAFGPVLTATHVGAFLTFWAWGLLLGQLAVAVYRVWFLWRMRRTLQRGEELSPPRNLKKRWLVYRIGHGLHVAAAVALIAVVMIRGFSSVLDYGEVRQPLAAFPGDPPFPTIVDLVPEDAVYEEQYFGFADDENTFALWATLPVERAIVWDENAKLTFSDGSTFTGGLYVEYYEAKNEWVADRLAKSLFWRDRASWNVQEIHLPELGLDYARGTDRVFNTVILREGNRVLRGYFFNSAVRVIDWNDWLTATAEGLIG